MAEVAKLEKKPEPKVDAEWCSIHKALPQITGAIPPITKARKNTQQSYAFRGVDDVYAVLNLLLEKFGVTIIPEVIKAKRESYQSKSGGTMFKAVLRVRYTLFASDGSSLACVVEGEAMDSGDKATQKALSMSYKYMAFQVFCIPTGEKIDTEEDSPEVVGPAQAAPAKEKPTTKPSSLTSASGGPGAPTATPALEGAAAQAANAEVEPDGAAELLIRRCDAGFTDHFEHAGWFKKHTPEINALPKDLQKAVVAAWRNAGPKS